MLEYSVDRKAAVHNNLDSELVVGSEAIEAITYISKINAFGSYKTFSIV